MKAAKPANKTAKQKKAIIAAMTHVTGRLMSWRILRPGKHVNDLRVDWPR
jgi:hypothetical protein